MVDNSETEPGLYGISNIDTWVQKKYREQMEHWLDYACDNHLRLRYRIPQTQLMTATGASKPAGGNGQKMISKPDRSRGPHRKQGANDWFNTWLLFEDWKKRIRMEHGPPGTHFRNFLPYHEAVPELHALLDFIDEQDPLARHPNQ